MEIRKQTLFLYKFNKNTGCVILFDLKTLTKLSFSSVAKAYEFCEVFQEKECLEELTEMYKTDSSFTNYIIYLSTDNVTKKHSILGRYSTGFFVSKCSSSKLFQYTKKGIVRNLDVSKSSNKIIRKWILEHAPIGFEECIQKQYNDYINSAMLIGNCTRFKYRIIGKYVILTWVGDTETLTVPNFVTSISSYIGDTNIKEIKLTDGVRYIGSSIVSDGKNLKLCGGKNVEYTGNGSIGNHDVIINRK